MAIQAIQGIQNLTKAGQVIGQVARVSEAGMQVSQLAALAANTAKLANATINQGELIAALGGEGRVFQTAKQAQRALETVIADRGLELAVAVDGDLIKVTKAESAAVQTGFEQSFTFDPVDAAAEAKQTPVAAAADVIPAKEGVITKAPVLAMAALDEAVIAEKYDLSQLDKPNTTKALGVLKGVTNEAEADAALQGAGFTIETDAAGK